MPIEKIEQIEQWLIGLGMVGLALAAVWRRIAPLLPATGGQAEAIASKVDIVREDLRGVHEDVRRIDSRLERHDERLNALEKQQAVQTALCQARYPRPPEADHR